MKMLNFKMKATGAAVILFLVSFLSPIARASAQDALSKGATLYVPIYSNVVAGPRMLTFELSAMLTIRNTDMNHPIFIEKVDYYDNDGKLLEHHVEKPLELGPLASRFFYIKEYDKRGGAGAKFIVTWRSGVKVNSPIIEGVMLGLKSGQGISFLSQGKVIEVHGK